MVIWDGCQHVKKNCKTIDLRGAQVHETILKLTEKGKITITDMFEWYVAILVNTCINTIYIYVQYIVYFLLCPTPNQFIHPQNHHPTPPSPTYSQFTIFSHLQTQT